MSTYTEVDEEKLSLSDLPEEMFKKVRRSVGLLGNSQKGDLFHSQGSEKRSRREIANCNERRRMQSINSGFESLKTLLPTEDGEKLSKAAILQLTSKYIQHLVGENRRMRDQLSQLQQQQQQRHTDLMLTAPDGASRKRKLGDGSGGVYIGYFQQQQQVSPTARPQQTQQQQQQQPPPPPPLPQSQPQPTFQLAVKPDYEQFVIEPPGSQIPQSPQPQAPANKPKRLEHLMMAIERIEGGSGYPLSDSDSPGPVPPVPERGSEGGEDCGHHSQLPQQPHPAIMISPFTPHCQQQLLSPVSDLVDASPPGGSLVVVDLAEAEQLCRPRAIPHKYLHRPQVVQANRSN